MPITSTGRKVLADMVEEYGVKKGKQVFYASINKGKRGSRKWHRSKSYSKVAVKMAREKAET